MTTHTATTTSFDFRKALTPNRLTGLWRIMTDFRLPYLGATAALAISAIAKSGTYLLLGYFANKVLTQQIYVGGTLGGTLALLGLAFILLAAAEGTSDV